MYYRYRSTHLRYAFLFVGVALFFIFAAICCIIFFKSRVNSFNGELQSYRRSISEYSMKLSQIRMSRGRYDGIKDFWLSLSEQKRSLTPVQISDNLVFLNSLARKYGLSNFAIKQGDKIKKDSISESIYVSTIDYQVSFSALTEGIVFSFLDELSNYQGVINIESLSISKGELIKSTDKIDLQVAMQQFVKSGVDGLPGVVNADIVFKWRIVSN